MVGALSATVPFYQRVSKRSIGYVVFVFIILGVGNLCRDIIRMWRVHSPTYIARQ
jgi:hypothetical protein